MNHKALYILLFLLTLTQSAGAVSVGVSLANMSFDVQAGMSEIKSIYVINTGVEESRYLLYVDDEYTDRVTISNTNFTMGPGEDKEVTFEFRPSLADSGELDFMAYVVSTDPSSDFAVGSGIKVPIHAEVSNTGLIAAASFTLLFFTTLGIIRIKKKKLS